MLARILHKLRTGLGPGRPPAGPVTGLEVPDCPHTRSLENTADLGEGLRFCNDCKRVLRLEKRRVPDRNPDGSWADPFFHRTLDREESISALKDLQARQRN